MRRPERIEAEAVIDSGEADIMIIGMGRVGTGAYDSLHSEQGRNPIGVDAGPDVVTKHRDEGRLKPSSGSTAPHGTNGCGRAGRSR